MSERVVHRWTTRTLMSFVLDYYGRCCRLDVVGEVPLAADGSKLPLRGNRYWPTTITFDGRPMTVDKARELATMLMAAADECDRADAQDTDVCGHWFPCGCGRSSAECVL
jgi:hypothetical protein